MTTITFLEDKLESAITDLSPTSFPLIDEPHIDQWEGYIEKASSKGVFNVLKSHFYTLRFPIEAGISDTSSHHAARLKGVMPSPFQPSLMLESPDSLSLHLHPSVAGTIPVLLVPNRADFVRLTQAFAYKNEPVEIPDSMGACMIAGFNNWDRIHAYRRQWKASQRGDCSEGAWQAEFKRLISKKHLYQDRFIIVHDGPYSGVTAAEIALDEYEWRKLSLKIRLEHECAHYFTKRVFGEMRRHVFDELLADFIGIVAALGYFRADWFLRFMGMEAYPIYREGGRLQNYLNDISLESSEFYMIQAVVKAAAENLEKFDRQLDDHYRSVEGQGAVMWAICQFSLVQLAKEYAPNLLRETLRSLEKQFQQEYGAGG